MVRRLLASAVRALASVSSAQTNVEADVRAAIGKSELARSDRLATHSLADHGPTPEPLVALAWGMHSTPALVLVDRESRAAMYHPGGMTREELEPRIQALLRSKASR